MMFCICTSVTTFDLIRYDNSFTVPAWQLIQLSNIVVGHVHQEALARTS